jgi:hypothetical protein
VSMSWSPSSTASAQRFANSCFQLLAEEGRSTVLSLPRDVDPGALLDQMDTKINHRGPSDFRLLRREVDGASLERDLTGLMKETLGELSAAEGSERPWEKRPVFVLVQVRQLSPTMPAKVPQELERWLDQYKAAREEGYGCRVMICVPAIVNEPRKLEHVALRRYPSFSADEFSSDLAEVLEQLLPPHPAQLAEYTRLCLVDASGGRARDLSLIVDALERLKRTPEAIAAFARNPWKHPELASAVEERLNELREHELVDHCSPSELHHRQEAPWRLWLLGASTGEPRTSSSWTLLTARTLAALARCGKPPEFIPERYRAAEQALISCFNFERKLRMTLLRLAQTTVGRTAYERALGSLWDPEKGITAQQSIRNFMPEWHRHKDPLLVASFGQLKRLTHDMCQADPGFETDLKRVVELRNDLAHSEESVSYDEFEWLRLLEARWDRQLLNLRSR